MQIYKTLKKPMATIEFDPHQTHTKDSSLWQPIKWSSFKPIKWNSYWKIANDKTNEMYCLS